MGTTTGSDHLRHHRQYEHLFPAFGGDAFGRRAEAFARYFGTPKFLIGQTAVVVAWIAVNGAAAALSWDPYPFILLNLAFSTQAAYAAPLILLAQTRQADRDKAHAEADARHREDIAAASTERQRIAELHTEQLRTLLEQNTALTEQTRRLTEEIRTLSVDIQTHIRAS